MRTTKAQVPNSNPATPLSFINSTSAANDHRALGFKRGVFARSRCKGFFVSILTSLSLATVVGPVASADEAGLASNRLPLTLTEPGYPYKAPKYDVSAELGVFEGRDPSTWVAALAGVRVGPCLAGFSASCEQHIDIIAGAATREAETYGMFLLAPRWQYVNTPDRLSPFWRVFVGLSPVNRAADRSIKPIAGLGAGFITYLHPKADLRLEARVGQVDQTFALAMLSVHLKVDGQN